MADAPTRVFAFDAYAARIAKAPLASPGVTVASKHVGAMLAMRGNPRDEAFLRGIHSTFGAVLRIEPNTAAGNERMRALWLGPDEWLLVSGTDATAGKVLNVPGATVTDVSHGRAVMRLGGRDARAVLAKICPLDLDPRRFSVDACAQTAMARINVIIDHFAPGVFDMYCPRSYASSFWHSVVEAAAEYGCEVAPPGPM